MDKTISKKMLVNVLHPEETRVAIVHDGRLMELNIEISGKEQTKGNIYKGVVLRVEPGLQAAFVDIGRAKPGFLQMGELHPDFWQWREDIPEEQRKRRPRIQEVLRRGQEIIVQVEKDERDNKGSALTTYLSLPGRYMVIMPGSDSSGISRKVEQESVRKGLKEIIAEMNIPEGIGYIIRTEAVGRSPEELHKDLESLLELYNGIKHDAAERVGAGEIYQDKGLIIRTIRDYFSDDIDEVLVDSKEAYNAAKDFFRETMPKCEKLVKLHREKRPIFSRFQLEEQIDQIYEKRVSLPSGGYLIIEPTEALVSIDVNSGKSSGEKGIEDTAFKTNMEAAEEAARQLRLRDLGGLIVIDFIDMRDRKHNHEVEKTLKQALKADKARVNLGRISDFGLLEMSRQRIAKTLNDAIHLACPHCEGRGKVKSVEAMALSFLRKVHGAAAKGTVAEVHGGLPLEVAYYLLNRKKRELTQIENDYDIEVTVKGKTSFLLNELELEIVKREKLPQETTQSDEAATRPSLTAVATEGADTDDIKELAQRETTGTDPAKKRKRRRKKKKSSAEPETGAGLTEQAVETPTEADKDTLEITEEPQDKTVTIDTEAESAEPADGEAVAKKRKRRRTRKPARPIEIETTEAAADSSNDTAVPADTPPPTATQDAGAKKAAEQTDSVDSTETAAAKPVKRTRKPRTTKKSEPQELVTSSPAAASAAPLPEPETASETAEAKPAKPRRKAPAKKVAVSEPVSEAEADEVKKPKSRTRGKKKEPESQ